MSLVFGGVDVFAGVPGLFAASPYGCSKVRTVIQLKNFDNARLGAMLFIFLLRR